jgi:DNA polymerase-3 subunit beta
VSVQQGGDITVPGRKLLDIFRALAEKTSVTLSTEGERVSIRGGRSRFTLSSLPAAEFPLVEEINAQQTLTVAQGEFRRLIDKTHFSMAQQDVRYYLNGLLLETDGKALRAVATDGHRLALFEMELAGKAKTTHQVIVPRKGVLELQRILGSDGDIELAVGTNHVRADRRYSLHFEADRWSFPEYGRDRQSTPHGGGGPQVLRQARRTAILEREESARTPHGAPGSADHPHTTRSRRKRGQVRVSYKVRKDQVQRELSAGLPERDRGDKVDRPYGLNGSCLIHAPARPTRATS